MKFRTAYVVKELSQRDFSELYNLAEEVRFLFEEGKAPQVSFPEIVGDVTWGFANFDPTRDLLVFSGGLAASAVAFGLIVARHGFVHIATYVGGRYEVYEVRLTHSARNSSRQFYTRQISPSFWELENV